MWKVDGIRMMLLLLMLMQGAFGQRPNFIVMQPDDLQFFEEWTPPAHFPARRDDVYSFVLPLRNIERLRTAGLQMRQAYTASPMCGTSRYSTMTGRYPSRSSTVRQSFANSAISDVRIPTTKLQDIEFVPNGQDCSRYNVAAVLSQNGYRSGVVGKWHLSRRTDESYNYDTYTAAIRDCGFDFAEGIYAENLRGFWNDGSFSHNMEYITDQAQTFLRNSTDNRPFFLYFNPTAPHGSGDVLEALTQYPCTATPEGKLAQEPVVPNMTAGTTCAKYRQTILDRARGSTDQTVLGSIWVDDAVGALFAILEDIGQLDNTFFLFQLDHGREGKGTLWEPGVRIAQFVHFPATFGTAGKTWDGLVSTVDIGPTILDFAGIEKMAPGRYPMDGLSWKNAVENEDALDFWRDERCLAFELGFDRAVRCGCDKYMALDGERGNSNTFARGQRFGVASDTEVLLNVCDPSAGTSVTYPKDSPETLDLKNVDLQRLAELRSVHLTHLERTRPMNNDYTPLQYSPTQTPTSSPTNILSPTANSEAAPTANPTGDPTAVPTKEPTVVAVTGKQTVSPTGASSAAALGDQASVPAETSSSKRRSALAFSMLHVLFLFGGYHFV